MTKLKNLKKNGKRGKQDDKIRKRQEGKRKLESDLEKNTEKMNSKRKKSVNKIVMFCNFLYFLKHYGR